MILHKCDRCDALSNETSKSYSLRNPFKDWIKLAYGPIEYNYDEYSEYNDPTGQKMLELCINCKKSLTEWINTKPSISVEE